LSKIKIENLLIPADRNDGSQQSYNAGKIAAEKIYTQERGAECRPEAIRHS